MIPHLTLSEGTIDEDETLYSVRAVYPDHRFTRDVLGLIVKGDTLRVIAWDPDGNAIDLAGTGALTDEIFVGKITQCRECGEDCVLAIPDDPESWVHAEWANDNADHSADPTLGEQP